jgi:hypothetical protein
MESLIIEIKVPMEMWTQEIRSMTAGAFRSDVPCQRRGKLDEMCEQVSCDLTSRMLKRIAVTTILSELNWWFD